LGFCTPLVGNNGLICADGSTKGARSINACSQSNMPVNNLQTTTTFGVARM
jgi:acetyl-CoA carboxylase carboxyltransferase component